jgi:hypothetical protein
VKPPVKEPEPEPIPADWCDMSGFPPDDLDKFILEQPKCGSLNFITPPPGIPTDDLEPFALDIGDHVPSFGDWKDTWTNDSYFQDFGCDDFSQNDTERFKSLSL